MHSAVPFAPIDETYFGTSLSDSGSFAIVGFNDRFVYERDLWDNYEMYGYGGSDRIIGGHGHDEIYGGDGNDVVSGGYGYNEMFGGSGFDTLDYSDFGLNSVYEPFNLGVNVQLSTQTFRYGLVQGQAFSRDGNLLLDDEFYSFENVKGSFFNDRLIGNSLANDLEGGFGADMLQGGYGNDYLAGGPGSDSLYGSSGNDDIFGGSGWDYLYGGNGNDQLVGGDNADVLWGGLGADSLNGGQGPDDFVYTSIAESTVDPLGRDIVYNFTQGVDFFDLEAIDTTPSTAADGDFIFIGRDIFTGAGTAELRYRYGVSGSNLTVIEGDVNGNGVADFAITVIGIFNFTENDFDL